MNNDTITQLSDLRKKRLLMIVASGRDTKRYYHMMYYTLIMNGYVSWALGHGFLTDKGKAELERLCSEQ